MIFSQMETVMMQISFFYLQSLLLKRVCSFHLGQPRECLRLFCFSEAGAGVGKREAGKGCVCACVALSEALL